MRLAVAGLEHGHGGLVRTEHLTTEHLASECIHQRLQVNAALAHPSGQRRARDREARSAEDGFLPVQGR